MGTQIIVKKAEVARGAEYFIIDPHTQKPATSPKGVPFFPGKVLVDGVLSRARFHFMDGDRIISGVDWESLDARAEFTPAETFSVSDAPVRREFAIYQSGKLIRYIGSKHFRVARGTDGGFYSWSGCSLQQRWALYHGMEADMILVPAGTFSPGWDFFFLGCIGIPNPTPEQRTHLAGLGVEFFDHAPFAEPPRLQGTASETTHTYDGYTAIRLPGSWVLREQREKGSIAGCPFEYDICDGAGLVIARITQNYGLRQCWIGQLNLR